MIIIAHRGMWEAREEGNTLEAFKRAFENGYGIETDIRDYMGDLVISHNVATNSSIPLKDLFTLYKEIGNGVPLALNVKADGLQQILHKYLEKYDIKNYFMFDMSVPEQVVYIRQKLHTFGRESEYENPIAMYQEVEGIWMDEFQQEWITSEIVKNHLEKGKRLGIISSEIHGHDEKRLWKLIEPFKNNNSLMLCTDIPKKAEEYFNEYD